MPDVPCNLPWLLIEEQLQYLDIAAGVSHRATLVYTSWAVVRHAWACRQQKTCFRETRYYK